jgi:DNA polymerase zeta
VLHQSTRKLILRPTVNAYILKLGVSLNRAMELTQKQRDEKKKRAPQYIAFILPCKGVPIYGYQVGYKVYLKIYYVNPRYGRALGEVLRGGAIMNTKFDLYEAHIPFHLQFMLDANLYGSGWVEVSADCRFRSPLPGSFLVSVELSCAEEIADLPH